VTSGLWYRAVATEGSIAATQLSLISDYFADALHFAGWPQGACLFLSGRGASTGAAVEQDAAPAAVCFSPAAIDVVPHLLAACGATPGPPPDRLGATLLVGKLSDWTLLPYEHH